MTVQPPRTSAPTSAPPTSAPASAATPSVPGQRTAPPASRRRVPVPLALVAASLPMFMATLDNLVTTSALPVVARDLSASLEQVQWISNAYTLTFAALMLTAAALGDRLGRRTAFLAGIAVFTAGSVAAALSTSPGALIAARAVQGVGAAAIVPLSLALLAAAVPASRRAAAIGVWGGVSGLGVALGPVVGGAVVQGWDWSAIFWINVAVAVVAVPLALLALPDGRGARQPLDVPGLLLGGLGVLGVVWGLVRGDDHGWTSVGVLGALVAGALLLAGFVVREATTGSPLLPLRLFRSRSFSAANAAGFAFSLGVFGAVFLLTQYLQVAQGLDPLAAGVRTLPWTAAPIVVAPVAGALAGRVGPRVLMVSGLSAQAASLLWMGVLLEGSPSYAALVPAFVLAGVGMGLTFAPSATAVLADLDEVDHAVASSANATVREVGVAVGVAALVAVFQGAGGAMTPAGFAGGVPPAVLVGAAVVALGALAALRLPGRPG